MAISTLLRAAFVASPDFNFQVNGVVVKEALAKGVAIAIDDPDAPSKRATLASVVAQPAGFPFVSAAVTDGGWELTYDGWAANPPAADGAILGQVQKHWSLLVGV